MRISPLASDAPISNEILAASRYMAVISPEDDEIVDGCENQELHNIQRIERVRGKLLAMEPRAFEHFVKDLLLHCGFSDVCVTRFTSDGGIDVNARAGDRAWIFENTLVQVQAKRWLHSVGRKEVAEFRGSLPAIRERSCHYNQPFLKGSD